MTAFEGGWSVLKMPVVPHSLQEVEPSGERGTRRNWRASFDDPKTGERLPVYLSAAAHIIDGLEPPFLAIEGGIGDSRLDKYGALTMPATMDAFQDMDAPNEWEVAFAHTDDELRRRGMATEYGGSLYGAGSLSGSEASQSRYARALWESNHQGGHDSWSPSRSLWRDRRDVE